MIKLTELNPGFFGNGGEGIYTRDENGERVPVPERKGTGIAFDCPCGCGERVALHFKNPLDGGESTAADRVSWQRTGDSFENLTLRPSILRLGGCAWHGFLTDGEFKSC